MHVYRLFLVLLGGAMLLAACGGNIATPTATIQATIEQAILNTDTPTALPLPTNTPVPTNIPMPTASPVPTIAPPTPTSTRIASPVAAAPATSKVMDFRLTYHLLMSCSGDIPEFTVVNLGNVILQSYEITVYDATTGFSESNSSNEFDKRNGCKTTDIIYLLNFKETGNIYSAPFSYDITGHKMEATVMLCSHNIGYGGKCIKSAKINFTP